MLGVCCAQLRTTYAQHRAHMRDELRIISA
jgi:hypothetical protein